MIVALAGCAPEPDRLPLPDRPDRVPATSAVPAPPLPPGCGDLVCSEDEACGTCPVDCGPCPASCVPDGDCAPEAGESCPACPADCGGRGEICGNGECTSGETPVLCMVDCGPPAWPVAWEGVEGLLLAGLNAERAAGSTCGSPAPPLAVAPDLTEAARATVWDLATSRYYDSTSCNGRTLADRAPTAAAELLGWGFGTPPAILAHWLQSCGPLVDAAHREVGLGYAITDGDPVWVALLR